MYGAPTSHPVGALPYARPALAHQGPGLHREHPTAVGGLPSSKPGLNAELLT
mgnify:CR=1 FL=1|jgi:hypothetical protein